MEVISHDFDPVFYRRLHPELTERSDEDLSAHYCDEGWQMGYDPAQNFSTLRYLEAYEDVAAAQINPFVHYITDGKKEGRDGMPRIAMDEIYDVLAAGFDPSYYRLINPQIAFLSNQRLLEHFHHYGWREGLDPNASFSVSNYLEDHSDVARRGIDPFYHYLTVGRDEGRRTAAPLPRLWEHLSEAQIIQLEAHFDVAFYGHATKNTEASPHNLLAHYIETGWQQGFDPSPDFSNDFYTHSYRDTHGVCPLIHFVLKQHNQARRGNTKQPQHFAFAENAQTASHRMVSVLKRDLSATPITPPTEVALSKGMDLHWIIPDFPKGSGGHMTIFRIIRHLENFGHRSTIWIEQPVFHKNAADAHDDILKYFQCLEARVRFVEEDFFETQGQVVIATSWATAYFA